MKKIILIVILILALTTSPSALIPTLPDTEFCKDVDYCIDVTVLNEGTENADVFGCIYCQDITIKNEDCTKVSGTFKDYATTEIPLCPEKIESVDVEALGLPSDIAKNITEGYEELLKGTAPAYLSIIQDVSAQPACEIDSVSWDRSDAWDGETVNIQIKTKNCADGTTVNLYIRENDVFSDDPAPGTWPVPITINGNSAIYTWTATWMDDGVGLPEYFAKVEGPTNTVNSEDMTVHTCMKVDWDRKQAYNNEEVNMVVRVTEKCIGRKVIFDIYEEDIGPDDDIELNYGETILTEEIKVPWKAKWVEDGIGTASNPPEFIFYAKIPEFGSNYKENSSLLIVSKCIKKAEWSEKSTDSGGTVSLFVETSEECKNKNIEITICEDDELEGGDCRSGWSPDDPIKTIKGAIDNNGKFSTTWTATFQESDEWGLGKSSEFYFIASVKDDGNVIDERASDILKVYRCIKRLYWSADSAFEGDEVNLVVETSSYCEGFDVEFEIKEDVSWGLDIPIITKIGPQITDGKSQVKWTVTRPLDRPNDVLEYYFIVKIDSGGNPQDEAESDRLTVNPCIKDALILCEYTKGGGWLWQEETVTEYIVIDTNRYMRLAVKEFPDEGETQHWILDMSKYIIANWKSCIKNNISKYTIIDNKKYLDNISKTYGNEEFYKKFVEMYGHPYADYLYCYKTVLKDTQWCQDLSRDWYGLENNSLDAVDQKYIDDTKKWNYYQEIDEMPAESKDAWTKVFTVTPLLNDTRNYLEWTKTGESSAYAGWGFDRKSLCSLSCDASIYTNAAPGCIEKSDECDTCKYGACGNCTVVDSSCPGASEDCYKPCKVDIEKFGVIVDPKPSSCAPGAPLVCPKDYSKILLTVYDRQIYTESPSYQEVEKCILENQVKGVTTFTIKDANVPDGQKPVKTRVPGTDNVWKITHPAFTITETGNIPYEITSIDLTKNGDVYTLTEFYKPESPYNKERFEIDADTVFNYEILPDANKLQIEVNHTYNKGYIKDTYYVGCNYLRCSGGCGCSGCSCIQSPTIEYNYNYVGCGETTEFQSCGCGGCCCDCEDSPGCGMHCSSTYRYERTTEIIDDIVSVTERLGFPFIWDFNTGNPVETSPAVKYGKVFINSNGKLYALDEFSGKEVWEFSLSGSMSSPTAADNLIFVGSGNGILYAIDEKTGNQIWTYTTPSSRAINTKPTVDNGYLFFGSDDNRIYAINASTGAEFWTYPTSNAVKSSPTVSDGIVFVGSDDNKVYALDEFSGNKKWEFTTGGAVKSSPTVSDGIVFVGSDDKKIYALNAYNGNPIWNYETLAAIRTTPAVHDYRVFVGSMDEKIYALDKYNGNLLWSYETNNAVLSSPAVSYNRIFVGSNDNNFYALDEDNGNLAWSYDAGSPIQSSPAVDKGMIFFGSGNKIYALSSGIFPAHEDVTDDAKIKIEGVIDRFQTKTGFYGETVIGEINITVDPDIVGSLILNGSSFFMSYTSEIYPVEHKLTAKESSSGITAKNYGYNDSYGYELPEFGYLEQCRNICPLECNCYEGESWNRLSPNCTEVSEEGELIIKQRKDCVCNFDWCYPEPCKSNRTFHEEEGSYIANGDFEQADFWKVPYFWNKKSGSAKQEFGGISGYKLVLNGEIYQNIPNLSTNPANEICLNYWINENNPGSFNLTVVVDEISKEFNIWNTASLTCEIPAGWNRFCTPIDGKLSQVGLKSSIEVFVDNVNLGKYYDFVELKTFSLEDVELMDQKASPGIGFGGISLNDITHENNTYSLKFSTTSLPYTMFKNMSATLITNFRNITIPLFPASTNIRDNPYVNVKINNPTKITIYKVEPGRFNLKPGTQVSIYLRLTDEETKNPIGNAEIIAIDECENEQILMTDFNGETTFTTTVQNMRNCANKIKFVFMGL